MTLRISTVGSFAELDAAQWKALFASDPAASIFQSWSWLTSWWKNFSTGRALIILVHEEACLVGAGAFFVDRKGVLRLIGDQHTDYGNVLCEHGRQDVMDCLVREALKAPRDIQQVRLDAVRLDTAFALTLMSHGAVARQVGLCPRVQFRARSAASLLTKSSLKRHTRALARQGCVEYLHLDSAEQIKPWADAFFQQHIERWALTDTPSLFLNPANVAFYRELFDAARPGGGLLFSVVLLDKKPAAMHVGFHSEGDLLWYKPTFDPRLAELGPGEVLLAALLRRAQDEGCSGLDFTRGNEAFKARFASETREGGVFEYWPTLRAGWAAAARRAARELTLGFLDILGCRPFTKILLQRLRGAYYLLCTAGIRATWRRTREIWQQGRSAPLCFYARRSCTPKPDKAPPVGFVGVGVHNIAELLMQVDPRDARYAELLASAATRLRAGDTLWLGRSAGEVVAYGWETGQPPLRLGEVKASLGFEAHCHVLYDFRVLPAYRRRGFYQALLGAVIAAATVEWLVIFARHDNVASRAGIEAALFFPCLEISHDVRRITLDISPSTPPLSVILPKSTTPQT